MYKKARWWGLWPCAYKDKVYGVEIDYGDWLGPTVLIHNARALLGCSRIRRHRREWLRRTLAEQGE